MKNMIAHRQKGCLAARNIATLDELLLNLDENLTAKCARARRSWLDLLVACYPLVHPGKRSTILICALSDL
jgi:hypothetical protein